MNRGFTLLEVLLALAVTAFVMTAGLVAVRGTAQRIAQVEMTLRAEWALENVRQELLLAGASPASPQAREEVVLGQAFVTQGTPTGRGSFALVTYARDRPTVPLAESTMEFTDAPGAVR